jgi:hypothetical protein
VFVCFGELYETFAFTVVQEVIDKDYPGVENLEDGGVRSRVDVGEHIRVFLSKVRPHRI